MELLQPEKHRGLRMRPVGYRTPHFVPIVVSEFVAAAASCPILFTKEAATGQFYGGALFGFRPGERFLEETLARGGFRPLNLERDGFFITGEHIAIDRSSSRFSETEGEPLFDGADEPSMGLRPIQRALGQLQVGVEATNVFIRALLGLRLIEPIDISLCFDGGERFSLEGLYTVSLDGIRELDDAAALSLFRSGHLQLAYLMHASLKQIAVLAELRNRRANGEGRSSVGGIAGR
jgi:hypothetical protein